jgi:hypothetical protein
MGHYIALTCSALSRTIYYLSSQSANTITVRLLKQGLHNRPRNLREVLQAELDTVQADECDAILLAYGMCGAATIGLTARHTPLVIPRAHDCITLYLGSRERYQEEFERHPGTYWYSVDYIEHLEKGSTVTLGAVNIEAEAEDYERYIAKFGQETADLLMEEMRKWSRHYTRAAFVDMGLGDSAHIETMARKKAEREGWVFERLEGDRRLLRMLIDGEWPEEEFLVVAPGQTIQQNYRPNLIDAITQV